MRRFILSPSLLSADFGNLRGELEALEAAGLEWVHWDVMDGLFVPNITFGPPVIKALRASSKLFFDVHLMIDHPERYIREFADAGADLLCVHAETGVHLERTISAIREAGMQTGLALNPATPLNVAEYLLPQLDMVLVMSVNPGFGGQKFIPFCKEKIAALSKMIRERGLSTLIQVDGGVTLDNARELSDLGADVLVSGSAFFGHPPYAGRYQDFQRKMES
ncbi:ribulose-phosphate 3-epimerase [Desulfomicrobium orale]|uniref:Ribulose-phosphate 3-epimerase n=1 Tax=Desulfomicrobium orale DSM 12838 TaxID=888061 RepID=A0A0X8JPA5_9BACT|nr:ribulose-phosphate 3-epimerase [Desulfomicrobium orale]AMD92489.1 ribulose phosphate epimerase [Desulfomicrobium orale DSM 12838]